MQGSDAKCPPGRRTVSRVSGCTAWRARTPVRPSSRSRSSRHRSTLPVPAAVGPVGAARRVAPDTRAAVLARRALLAGARARVGAGPALRAGAQQRFWDGSTPCCPVPQKKNCIVDVAVLQHSEPAGAQYWPSQHVSPGAQHSVPFAQIVPSASQQSFWFGSTQVSTAEGGGRACNQQRDHHAERPRAGPACVGQHR